jgi:transposase
MKMIKTKKNHAVNPKTLIATVDVGKTTNFGYCRCPDGTESKVFKFFNNGWGFKKFWNYLYKAMKINNLEEVVVGFESTGSYGQPLLHFLWKKNAKLVQVNPMHTKKLKELQGNSPNKTDKKDPKVIADIIELGHALTVVVPEGAAAELRRLTQAREKNMKRHAAISNQLQDLVFVIFPEFLQIMKGVRTKSAQYFLEYCPTPQNIIKYGLEELALKLKKISRNQLGKERAKELYNAARESVGIQEGRGSILLEVRECLVLMREYRRFNIEIEKQMSNFLKQIPYTKIILSIKGIKEITAAGLIGEVGDFRKFKSIAEITKLAGLDLFEISSGNHKGKCHISKRGRSLLRKLLYFSAMNMIRKGGIFHEWYQKALQRGMPKVKALIAVSRKLLGLIFALVRDHVEYVIDYSKELEIKETA